MVKLTPERYHVKNHGPWPFADCIDCGRSKWKCEHKVRYQTREEADEVVKRINESEGYKQPQTRYVCRWCLKWHTATAKGKISTKRAERARRRWLIENYGRTAI